MSRGRLIVLYGVNNLGKTTQLDLLAKALRRAGGAVATKKSPNYDSPSGELIYKLLRSQADPVSPTELQLAMAVNLQQDNAEVRRQVADGQTVIFEDYWGTTLAWSAGKGVPSEVIRPMLAGLAEPDISILLHGNRFLDAKETGHIHESNDDLTERVQQHHLELADEFGWQKVDANQSIEQVHAEILTMVGLPAVVES